MIEILPLDGVGEITEGDALADILCAAITDSVGALRAGDIVVVTQKIVSKAEGRWLKLADVSPSANAIELAENTGRDPRLVEVVLSESSAIIRATRNVLITRHTLGFVMANAGIDRSNLGPGCGEDCVLLLPRDPDGSARSLSEVFDRQFGGRFPVVITDSFGRPWRNGVVNVAIGASGLPSLMDQRGASDRDGRLLEVTQVAVADLIASAAALVMGEGAEGVPAAVVRGLPFEGQERDASALVRPLDEDLFQ